MALYSPRYQIWEKEKGFDRLSPNGCLGVWLFNKTLPFGLSLSKPLTSLRLAGFVPVSR